jgi:hypothetical protein
MPDQKRLRPPQPAVGVVRPPGADARRAFRLGDEATDLRALTGLLAALVILVYGAGEARHAWQASRVPEQPSPRALGNRAPSTVPFDVEENERAGDDGDIEGNSTTVTM